MTKKDGVIELWKKVFRSDSDQFIDMYFNKVYSDKNTFVKYHDDIIVSAVQMIPYSMTYNGTAIETGYISGASTLPEFESKGFMSSLMFDAINTGYKRGDVLMTLIPANEGVTGFYKRFGFIAVFRKNENIFHLPDDSQQNMILRIDSNNCGRFYDYFNGKMSERDNCLQHSFSDFMNICTDADMQVFAFEKNGIIDSLVCCSENDVGVFIKELLYDDEVSKEILLSSICSLFNISQITYRDYCSTRIGKEYGMGRIINVRKILSVFATNNIDIRCVFKVSDHIIKSNNSFYIIENGIVENTEIYDGDDYIDMKIEDVMKYIITDNVEQSPDDPFYMSLMLE